MDNECLRIAVSLRLGILICGLHPCRHCGSEVDVTGRHALSCRIGEGRLHRHSALRVAANRLCNILLMVAMHDYYYCIFLGLFHYNTRTKYLPKAPLTNFRALGPGYV